MKTLKTVIDKIQGLRFIVDLLELKSGVGKRLLLSQPFITNQKQLETEFENLDLVLDLLNCDSKQIPFQSVFNKLYQVKDIHNTLIRVEKSEYLDDVEFFEIKSFAIVCQEISILNAQLEIGFLKLPDLQSVIDILDPDQQNIPHFYIYSSYSKELLKLREDIKKVSCDNPTVAEELRQKMVEVEDSIREKLSALLAPFASSLSAALHLLSYLDLLIAKAQVAQKYGFVRPAIQSNSSKFEGLFNPQLKALLESKQKNYQPIDIELFNSPCLITGVNMGGKTVLLKTIGLVQYLFQFGFYIPAKVSQMSLVDEVLMSIGDDQSELNGLSSFASEMMKVDEIVRKSKTNKKILVLIDELARTTNPEEGKAIVNATLDILSNYNICCLVTTHYSGLRWNGRRLAVRGLITDKLTNQLTIKNINDFMDYTLIESNSKIATNQAIQIAKLLGVEDELITKASDYLTK